MKQLGAKTLDQIPDSAWEKPGSYSISMDILCSVLHDAKQVVRKYAKENRALRKDVDRLETLIIGGGG